MKTSPGSPLRSKVQKRKSADDRLPATTSLTALVDNKKSDRQFRRLVQNLLTVARRLEMARDYFGRQINVTGPQYSLLMAVAQFQGATGVSVGSVAQAMHVSSPFVTLKFTTIPNAQKILCELLRLIDRHRVAALLQNLGPIG